MLRKIMVPVDGSAFAERSLPLASALARRQGAALDLALVHVRFTRTAPEVSLVHEVSAWDTQQKQQEANYLHALAGRLHTEEHVPVEPHLLAGDVVTALEKTARSLGADMVVMTTHGRSGMERAWLGSVADGLVRRLDIPILLIRPSDATRDTAAHAPTSYTHILIPLDGSDLAERAIEPALELAPDAHVTLLRVVSSPVNSMSPYLPHAVRITREQMAQREEEAEEYVRQRAKLLRARRRMVEAVVVHDTNEADAILTYARECAVDLVAMSTHGRNPVARMLLGSITDRVVRRAEVPVLVC